METTKNFNKITGLITGFVSALSDEAFVNKPARGWSVSDILEHLNLSDKSGYLAIIREGIASQELETLAKEKMAIYTGNTDIQLVAPEAAEPTGRFTEVAASLKEYNKTRNRISVFIEANDLSTLAAGFEHPRLGMLTRKQWIDFLNWHGIHHLKQMKSLSNAG